MYYVKALRDTNDMFGRSTRMELWTFILCMHGVVFVTAPIGRGIAWAVGVEGFGSLGFVVYLLHMVPLASLMSRRAWDLGFGFLSPLFIAPPLWHGLVMFWFEYMVDFPDSDGGEAMLMIGGMTSLLMLALIVLTCLGSRRTRGAV